MKSESTTDENVVDSNSSETTLYHSQSNQDLYNLYDDVRAVDYPEHVLKVYKPDQTCKYLLVHKVRIFEYFLLFNFFIAFLKKFFFSFFCRKQQHMKWLC